MMTWPKSDVHRGLPKPATGFVFSAAALLLAMVNGQPPSQLYSLHRLSVHTSIVLGSILVGLERITMLPGSCYYYVLYQPLVQAPAIKLVVIFWLVCDVIGSLLILHVDDPYPHAGSS
jgi:hypothetical protein